MGGGRSSVEECKLGGVPHQEGEEGEEGIAFVVLVPTLCYSDEIYAIPGGQLIYYGGGVCMRNGGIAREILEVGGRVEVLEGSVGCDHDGENAEA